MGRCRRDAVEGTRRHRRDRRVPGAFSFAGLDLADSYAELHATVVTLLGDGAEATHAGADALRAVRDDFLRYEDIAQSELYALWQPVR